MPGFTTSISLTFVAVGSVLLGLAAARPRKGAWDDWLPLTGNVAMIVGALGVLAGAFMEAESKADVGWAVALGAACIAIVAGLTRLFGRFWRTVTAESDSDAATAADELTGTVEGRSVDPASGRGATRSVELRR